MRAFPSNLVTSNLYFYDSSQTNRDLLLCNPDFLTHELAKKAFFFFSRASVPPQSGVGGPGAVAGPWRKVSWPNNLKVKKISRIFFNINVDCYTEIWES